MSKHFTFTLLATLFGFTLLFAQPPNDDCPDAEELTIDGGEFCSTTNGAGFQGGEDDGTGGCVTTGASVGVEGSGWITFNTGSETEVLLDLDVSNAFSAYPAIQVYGPFAGATSGCLATTPVACAQFDATNNPARPSLQVQINGLTTNSYYMIQIIGKSAGGPNDDFVNYCAEVVNTNANNCDCAAPCGPACGFSTTPTVATVTSSCPEYEFYPNLQNGQSGEQCYTFQAVNTSVDLVMIANSTNCIGGGTISNVDFEVYNSGACGSAIQTFSGVPPFPSVTGLTPGNFYTFCYTPTSACDSRMSQYPYFVGAAPLPVNFLHVSAQQEPKSTKLEWLTANEENLSHYTIERRVGLEDEFQIVGEMSAGMGVEEQSTDKQTPNTDKEALSTFTTKNGVVYSVEKAVGTGKTTTADSPMTLYTFEDHIKRSNQTLYYRVRANDYDGSKTYSDVVAMHPNQIDLDALSVYPNPTTEMLSLSISQDMLGGLIVVEDLQGRPVMESVVDGMSPSVDVADLPAGTYILQVSNGGTDYTTRFVKQ